LRDLDGVLSHLQLLISSRLRIQEQLAELARSGLDAAFEDQHRQDLQEEERRYRDRCRAELEDILEFPPRHIRHAPLLKRFWDAGNFDESVFIMSKFPEKAGQPLDEQLERVLAAVSTAVTTAGFVPRIATAPSEYHQLLWDNVELHLLGCRQGIAIVEDKYMDELNPNVMMEWGWMRAMGRPVLFLVEDSFQKFRADVGGLLSRTFTWDDPENSVPDLAPWLSGLSR
jgi:hypothetical protein